MEQTKWFDRKFDFSYTQNIFPSITERLKGTPARLEEKVQAISDSIAIAKTNGGWSVKENIGHLIDLEPLWMGRLEDILNKEEYLRATDLANKKTDEANHNARSVKDLLQEFRSIRKNTISRIDKLSIDQIYLTALHPRLKTPMRLMDHFLFVAEHDDHHLVKIQEIIQAHAK
jgi:uncharacterized damage-inducible protein DinB